MSGTDWSDWLLWLGGGALALLGLWLLLWAFCGDWVRTRKKKRRCPRCWYDMSGCLDSLTCSECGKTVKRERRLFKSRRRWRWAALACLFLLASPIIARFKFIKGGGWAYIVPTSVLVWAMPYVDGRIDETAETDDYIAGLLYSRLKANALDDPLSFGLSDPQWRTLILGALPRRSPWRTEFSSWKTFNLHDAILLTALENEIATRLELQDEILAEIIDCEVRVAIESDVWNVTAWNLNVTPKWDAMENWSYKARYRDAGVIAPYEWIPREINQRIKIGGNGARNVLNVPPPTGHHALTFDVWVDHFPFHPSSLNGSPLWTRNGLFLGTRTCSIDYQGLKPEASPGTDAVFEQAIDEIELLVLNDQPRGMIVRLAPGFEVYVDDLRIAATLELLRGDEIMATAQDILRPFNSADSPPRLTGTFTFTQPCEALRDPNEADSQWTLRLRGNESLANQLAGGTRFWSGEINVPIDWSKVKVSKRGVPRL